MGIKLDWDVENQPVAAGAEEAPEFGRARTARRRRTTIAMLLMGLLVAGVVGGVIARLRYVDAEIEQQLRDTVAAEMAALRIGDIAGYLTVQRSESDAWMLGQTDRYWQYQELKRQYDVNLTGAVLDLAIDENRGRVLVEEIIAGQRYQQLWFYWRYADGWRHVPLDVAFWGEAQVASGSGYTIDYGAVDAPLVEALQPGVERLWGQGCTWLACTTPLPALTIQVMPDPVVGVSWSPDEPDVLRVASPLLERIPVETPLLPTVARQIGVLLAERILLQAVPDGGAAPGTDAAFIRGALQDWLVGRFLAEDGAPGSTFVASLVDAYGERVPGLLAAGVPPDGAISSLALVFSTPLQDLRVDWREFFQWRLALEPFWLAQGNTQALLGLYDELAQDEAWRLISTPGAASQPTLTVLRVVSGPGTDGVPRAWAVVQYPDGSEGPITFRLVDGVWRRSIPDPAFDTLDGG